MRMLDLVLLSILCACWQIFLGSGPRADRVSSSSLKEGIYDVKSDGGSMV